MTGTLNIGICGASTVLKQNLRKTRGSHRDKKEVPKEVNILIKHKKDTLRIKSTYRRWLLQQQLRNGNTIGSYAPNNGGQSNTTQEGTNLPRISNEGYMNEREQEKTNEKEINIPNEKDMYENISFLIKNK